jgi:hypothetical protein
VIYNILYWLITLNTYSIFSKYQKLTSHLDDYQFFRRIVYIFGITTLNSLLVSLVLYPVDTFKRHLQVNSSFGYNSFYHNSGIIAKTKKFISQGPAILYSGVTIHIFKTLPFSFLHYTMFKSIINLYPADYFEE